MKTIELSKEQQLVLENLKLKAQMAELRRDLAMKELASYTRELLTSYGVPPHAHAILDNGRLEIAEEELTPQPATSAERGKAASAQQAMSQADLRKLAGPGKYKEE